MAQRPLSSFKWEERKYGSLMNSLSSCGLFWAKQALALFAILISQMVKLSDIWHQIKITWKNFIHFFLLSWWDFSSVSGSEHCSLKRAGNGELFLSVLLSYSVCLRTGSFGLGSEYPAPIHDSWLWMRHMLLQVFLERDVSFHLGRRKQPNLCSHQSTAVFLLFREIWSICRLLSVSASSANPFCSPGAFVGPVASPGSLGAQVARCRCDRNRDMSGADHRALPCPDTEHWISDMIQLEISFLDRCSSNSRLKPDPTWGNFSGCVCNWSCGVRWEGGALETGFAAKTGDFLIFTPHL